VIKLIALGFALAAAPTLGAASEIEANPSIESSSTFDAFKPRAASLDITLDYESWDDALRWFVLPMGASLRQVAPRRVASSGSRLIYGHDSIYRLEGNRVAYSLLQETQKAALTEYRRDLERIGSELDLAGLPRNEQLAFWINLHNVAVIEQIALAYPVQSPRNVKVNETALDEAKFITVAGVAMSPQDIRTKIVYPNWRDPRVIYSFFRGDIGGPSLPRRAFTAKYLDQQLASSAREFVNSLRGVSRSGDRMRVSEIYREAEPFYFTNFDADLRTHLTRFAENDVQQIIDRTNSVSADIYETDIADLSKGERDSPISQTEHCTWDPLTRGPGDCRQLGARNDLAVQIFIDERVKKIERLIEAGKLGTVIILQEDEALTSPEVD